MGDASDSQGSLKNPLSSLSPVKTLKNVSCVRVKIGHLEQKTYRQELALENAELNLKQINGKFEPLKMTAEKYTDKKMFELKKLLDKIIEINKKTSKKFEKELEVACNNNAKINADVSNLQGQVSYIAECVAQLQAQVFGNYETTQESKLLQKQRGPKFRLATEFDQ
ncbi:hypothetical protein RFI_11696 [Reticulomyxa filosa]|uniref:Uncharacterized protein n=1 Tax=Reticulomyxa filosa TaxID=46433 RepID=X6NHJ3_RETFI|nr:hypothetical protein RFI_11696 [Reticulomyxa filosa]|eukprot:ETO25441.1 hypothetical protein RFI_11696 [Reticulomyxa filosa]